VLAKEMVIVGEVSFKGKARFDGTVDGNITGEYLILSDTAKVTGNIEVSTLVCHGKVEGNVIAEVVTAHSTSSIHGILKSENLTVESGAALDGEIHASTRKQSPGKPFTQQEAAGAAADASGAAGSKSSKK
jgi:cytoskeletal protein CcmA (bactofilin family)